MRIQNFCLGLISTLLLSQGALGALALSAVGGASANSTNFLTIYGGLGGTCVSPSGDSTCDSCTGNGPGFQICNKRRIHDSLSLTLTYAMNSTESAGTGVRILLVQSTDNTLVYESTPRDVAVNTTYSESIPWSQICSNFGVSCNNPGSAVNSSKTFYFGVDKDLNGIPDEAARVTLTIRLLNPDSAAANSTDCGSTDQAGQGLCYFSVEKGDEKAYISDFAVASDYPAVGSMSGNSFVAAYFYIGEFTTDAATTIASIRNNNSSERIPLVVGATGTKPTLSDNRIQGLQNGVAYCFVAVNEDIAGNLFRASSITSNVCATPEPVVGLLDDKNCFIATASFGDANQQPVVTLRQFRDRFLKTSEWGQKLIQTYYNLSPSIAQVISENSFYKMIVKILLIPFVVLADLLLFSQSLTFFLVLAFAFWAILKLQQRKKA